MANPLRWIWAICVVVALTSATSFVLLNLSGALQLPQCSDGDQACFERLQIATERASLYSTIVGISLSAVGTFALVVTLYLSHRATEAAVAASEAANHAVRLAEETAARELRPYISQKSWNLQWRKGDDGIINAWRVRVHWENTGLSTAFDVRARANHELVVGELPADFRFPDREVGDVAGSLGREKLFFAHTAWLPVQDVESVLSSQKKLHAWSWVEYEGFEARVYRTEWHVVFTLWDGPATNEELKSSASFAENFNGADERSYHASKRKLKTKPRSVLS